MTVDVMTLRRESADFTKTLSRRNYVEVFASGLVVALFGVRFFAASTLLESWGAGLVVIGAIVIAILIAKRGVAPIAEPATSTHEFLEQRREELLYQARLLRWVPVWYIGPLVPGMGLLTLDAWQTTTSTSQFLAGFLAPIAIILVGVIGLNAVAARRLQAQAENLPTLG